MDMLQIKLKGIRKASHKYFTRRRPLSPYPPPPPQPDPRGWVEIHFFQKMHGHVAYQIKGNWAYSTMQAHNIQSWKIIHSSARHGVCLMLQDEYKFSIEIFGRKMSKSLKSQIIFSYFSKHVVGMVLKRIV